MSYRRRPSPLHAARAVVGALWCLAVVTAALTVGHPLLLGALILGVALAGTAALVAREVFLALALSVPFGLLVVAVNGVTNQRGLTVAWTFWEGFYVTFEALAQGAVYALSFAAIIGTARLYSACVDPDDLLRAFRRVSFSSALTAALATRMLPVLIGDGRRLADAQRCRPGARASRLTLVRAVATNALDRALDVAATLEVRGYGRAGARADALRRSWSRHDLAFAASAVALLALAVVGRVTTDFAAFPTIAAPVDGGTVAVALALVAVMLAPFADRRGVV